MRFVMQNVLRVGGPSLDRVDKCKMQSVQYQGSVVKFLSAPLLSAVSECEKDRMENGETTVVVVT